MSAVFGLLRALLVGTQGAKAFIAQGQAQQTSTCAAFIAASDRPRWVRLSGCRVAPDEAIARVRDTPRSKEARLSELFVPIAALGDEASQVRLVLQLRRPDRAGPNAHGAWVAEALTRLEHPEVLEGCVEPFTSAPRASPDAVVVAEWMTPSGSWSGVLLALGGLMLSIAVVLFLGPRLGSWLRERLANWMRPRTS